MKTRVQNTWWDTNNVIQFRLTVYLPKSLHWHLIFFPSFLPSFLLLFLVPSFLSFLHLSTYLPTYLYISQFLLSTKRSLATLPVLQDFLQWGSKLPILVPSALYESYVLSSLGSLRLESQSQNDRGWQRLFPWPNSSQPPLSPLLNQPSTLASRLEQNSNCF